MDNSIANLQGRWLCALLSIILLCSAPQSAATADDPLTQPRINLQPILTSGLNAPVYVTNARDGSERLFIIEQEGRIKVLRPDSPTPSIFLDISNRVLSGGERGLLGLAFHPRYAVNGRFFVNYTRRPDGATVIAEYGVSTVNSDVADVSEIILLTISQPFSNHNGGMIEFGPDGFLYIGTGDGGSGNDPGNRAQDLRELLGKILRIDVDRSGEGRPYAIPASNPFANGTNGRAEIYSLGLRNPWRFSFDRATGRLYAGDVGQSAIEEVDIITVGGNFGWRVLEGNRCTNLGPASCFAGGFIPPVAEYGHDQGRCSITGGYVYRGKRSSLPAGAYIYADYCSGEIFMLSEGTSTLLLSSALNIVSFGEDEAGEIYVVGQAGTIHRIVNPDSPAAPAVFFPRYVTITGSPQEENEFTGFAAVNRDSAAATLTFRASDREGSLLAGPGITNPSIVELHSGEQVALVDTQIFGPGIAAADRSGWVSLESGTPKIAAFFLAFNPSLTVMDGADVSSATLMSALLPEVEEGGVTQICIANPQAEAASIQLRLMAQDGSSRAAASREIAAGGALLETLDSLFPGIAPRGSDYLTSNATSGVVPFQYAGRPGRHMRGLNGQDATGGNSRLYAPQYVLGGNFRSTLSVVNLEGFEDIVTFRFFSDAGEQAGVSRNVPIRARGKLFIRDPAFFADFGPGLTQGYVEITSGGARLAGSVSFSDPEGDVFAAALPLISSLKSRLVFGQVASNTNYFTGIAVLNPGDAGAAVTIEVFDRSGKSLARRTLDLSARARSSLLLTEYFPSLDGEDLAGGYIYLTADRPVASFALFGTTSGSVLSAIPAQER